MAIASTSTGYQLSNVNGVSLTDSRSAGAPFRPNVWILSSSNSSTDIGGVAGFLQGFGSPPVFKVGAVSTAGAYNQGWGQGLSVGDLVINIPLTTANTVQPRLHIVTASTAHYSTSASSYAAGGFDVTLSST